MWEAQISVVDVDAGPLDVGVVPLDRGARVAVAALAEGRATDARIHAAADVAGGVLRVHAVHEDEPWDAATRAAVDAEIADLARWLDLDLVRAP